MNKKRRSSQLWSYFSIVDDSTKIAQCDLCGQKLCYKSTISNLKKHIERRHPTVQVLNVKKRLESLEQTHTLFNEHVEMFEEHDQEMIQANIKSEMTVSPVISEVKTHAISQDSTCGQKFFVEELNIIRDDEQSNDHVMSAERLRSSIQFNNSNDTGTCEEDTGVCDEDTRGENPHLDSQNNAKPCQMRSSGTFQLEQLVVRAIQAQGEVVNKILITQHKLAKQLLEADRERQARQENKLDRILDRLDQLVPYQLSTNRIPVVQQEYIPKESSSPRLNQLLDRLERTLPLISPSPLISKKKETDRRLEDTLETILERLDRSLPSK